MNKAIGENEKRREGGGGEGPVTMAVAVTVDGAQ